LYSPIFISCSNWVYLPRIYVIIFLFKNIIFSIFALRNKWISNHNNITTLIRIFIHSHNTIFFKLSDYIYSTLNSKSFILYIGILWNQFSIIYLIILNRSLCPHLLLLFIKLYLFLFMNLLNNTLYLFSSS
jgi:hypothetical protein